MIESTRDSNSLRSSLLQLSVFKLHMFLLQTFDSIFPSHNGKILFQFLLYYTFSIASLTTITLVPVLEFLMALTLFNPSHSSDLVCVGAQRVMVLGRLLVQRKHLLSGGSRSSGI